MSLDPTQFSSVPVSVVLFIVDPFITTIYVILFIFSLTFLFYTSVVSQKVQDLTANSVTIGTRDGHSMTWGVWKLYVEGRIPLLDLYLFDLTH